MTLVQTFILDLFSFLPSLLLFLMESPWWFWLYVFLLSPLHCVTMAECSWNFHRKTLSVLQGLGTHCPHRARWPLGTIDMEVAPASKSKKFKGSWHGGGGGWELVTWPSPTGQPWRLWGQIGHQGVVGVENPAGIRTEMKAKASASQCHLSTAHLCPRHLLETASAV